MPALFSTLQGLIRALPALGVALFLAAPASAQVDYVREVVLPDGMTKVISAPQAPYETSSPDYSTPASPTPYFFTQTKFYPFDSNTGVVAVAEGLDLPPDVKLGDISVGVLAGQNTSDFSFFAVSSQRFLLTFNLSTGENTPSSSRLASGIYTSLAARDSDGLLLSLIADTVLGDNQHSRWTGSPGS